MLCDKCGANEAVVHRIMVINGKKTEQHLCGECAKGVCECICTEGFHICFDKCIGKGFIYGITLDYMEAVCCFNDT